MYIDGVARINAVFQIGRIVTKAAIVLGQDQDSYMGSFRAYQSLLGNLTSVNMWDKVLTAQEISALTSSCSTAVEGNFVKWSDLKNKGEGNVELIYSPSCA